MKTNEQIIDEEVERLLALPDDQWIDEITVRLEALSPDRKELILAALQAILRHENFSDNISRFISEMGGGRVKRTKGAEVQRHALLHRRARRNRASV
jgi:hypothetical protein